MTGRPITFGQEKLDQRLKDEIITMARGYYATTPAHHGIPPYDFRWEAFDAMDAMGMLLVTTAREGGGELIGFTLYFLSEHLHHRGLIIASCDGLVVAPAARGRGVGQALYEFTEPLLAAAGAHRVVNAHRLCYGSNPIFPRLGFEAEETMFIKHLGEPAA